MQCPRCGFENMPGLVNCARCRSMLVATKPIDVHPPRAGRLKPLRSIKYALRRMLENSQGESRISLLLRLRDSAHPELIAYWAMWASLIPGLGHVLIGQARRIVWWWLAWLILLAAGLYIYALQPGVYMIGVAMALHAWIMVDAGGVRKLFGTHDGRFLIVLGITWALMFGGYNGIRQLVGRWVIGGYSSIDMPDHNIRKLDFVLIQRGFYQSAEPERNDVAEVDLANRYNGGYVPEEHPAIVVHGGRIVGQILALPGDAVDLKKGKLTVKTPQGIVQERSAPGDLSLLNVGFTVPEGQYFCALGWKHETHVRLKDEEYIKYIYLAEKGDILGRGFMVYNPPWRQHWLVRKPFERQTDETGPRTP